jgi:uncharacterized protein YxjI
MPVYKLRERLLSIGDDYWIEDAEGQKAYRVDGKALRLRKTLFLEDRDGRRICKIQERKLRIRDTMEIEDPDGERIAMIRKALITPLRDRFSVEMADGPELDVKGNILDHEYEIERDGEKIAEVSKKWLRLRDTYGIEVAEGEDDAVILAIAVAIDVMSHDVGDAEVG